MISYKQGNLLDVTSGVIIHGCNSHGVMGAGVARAVREKYPSVFEAYRSFCQNRGFVAADLVGRICGVQISPDLAIVNAITQAHTGNDGRRYVSYDAVDDVMANISRTCPQSLEIHMPKIGAGLGGGDWDVIAAIIDDRLFDRNVTIWSIV